MLFDDVLQCAIPTFFFSFSMFFILVILEFIQTDQYNAEVIYVIKLGYYGYPAKSSPVFEFFQT